MDLRGFRTEAVFELAGAVGAPHGDAGGSEALDLGGDLGDSPARGDRGDLVAIGVRLDHLEGLGPDTPRAPENRDSLHPTPLAVRIRIILRIASDLCAGEPVAPLAGLVALERALELGFTKIGPHHLGEMQLAVGQLPE